MARNLLVVESPAKARTIKKYLGPDYEVLPSYGHVRDLVPKDGAVEPENGFLMHYEPISRNAKHVGALSRAMKKAKALYLATDPDREGEAISWHVIELLRDARVLDTKPVRRVVFHEITKRAIDDAIANPREISTSLVNAQQARRALDYLVGFNLSPLLWKKIRKGLSAGRVQSPALRMIVEREEEIERFEKREYWTIEADLASGGVAFTAKLVRLKGEKVEQFSITDEAAARMAQSRLEDLISSARASSDSARDGHEGPRRHPARARRREEAEAAQPGGALHHLDPAAGSGAKARLHRKSDDARGPAALRGRRYREWCSGPHHVHAHRLDDPGGRSGGGDSRLHRARVREWRRAAPAARIPHQREERAGGARGDSADFRRADPRVACQVAGARSGQALRADLEAYRRVPDAATRPSTPSPSSLPAARHRLTRRPILPSPTISSVPPGPPWRCRGFSRSTRRAATTERTTGVRSGSGACHR